MFYTLVPHSFVDTMRIQRGARLKDWRAHQRKYEGLVSERWLRLQQRMEKGILNVRNDVSTRMKAYRDREQIEWQKLYPERHGS